MRNIIVPVVSGRVDMTSGFRPPGRPTHNGVDFFPIPRGTRPPVLAFDDGVVTFVQHNNRTAGNWLEIRHDNGLITTYMHLESIFAANGQSVQSGQQIGVMGTTGDSTGVHLHFETRTNPTHNGGRNAFDPMPFILNRMIENEREVGNMRIAISSGHGLHVRGASSLIDEVDEARRVVNRLNEIMPSATVFHDDTSRTQAENVNALVNWHNSQNRDLDVQVHLNAIDGIQDAGIGVETLYREGNADMREMASRISRGISNASGLILRRNDGTFAQTGIGFLNNTRINRAVLLEICFVNSRTDVRLYQDNFEAICQSIARSLTGQNTPVAAPISAPPPVASSPPPLPNLNTGGVFRVRVGSFASRIEADAIRDRLRASGHGDAWTVQVGNMWQAQAASGPNLEAARDIAETLRVQGFSDVVIV